MSETPVKKAWYVRLWAWLKDYWTDVAITVGPCAAAISFFCFTDEFIKFCVGGEPDADTKARYKIIAGCCIAVFSTVTVVAAFRHVRKSRRLSDLTREIRTLTEDQESVIKDLRAAISGYLWGITEDHAFNNNDRLTIYGFDSAASQFVPYKRICKHPTHRQHNRTSIPINQGFIGKTWNDGEFFIDGLPDWTTHRADYKRAVSLAPFPKALHGILRMKSRCYYGWRIMTADNREPLAVLIMESLEPDRWSHANLQRYFAEHRGKLCSIFERAHRHLPEPSDAAERGL